MGMNIYSANAPILQTQPKQAATSTKKICENLVNCFKAARNSQIHCVFDAAFGTTVSMMLNSIVNLSRGESFDAPSFSVVSMIAVGSISAGRIFDSIYSDQRLKAATLDVAGFLKAHFDASVHHLIVPILGTNKNFLDTFVLQDEKSHYKIIVLEKAHRFFIMCGDNEDALERFCAEINKNNTSEKIVSLEGGKSPHAFSFPLGDEPFKNALERFCAEINKNNASEKIVSLEGDKSPRAFSFPLSDELFKVLKNRKETFFTENKRDENLPRSVINHFKRRVPAAFFLNPHVCIWCPKKIDSSSDKMFCISNASYINREMSLSEIEKRERQGDLYHFSPGRKLMTAIDKDDVIASASILLNDGPVGSASTSFARKEGSDEHNQMLDYRYILHKETRGFCTTEQKEAAKKILDAWRKKKIVPEDGAIFSLANSAYCLQVEVKEKKVTGKIIDKTHKEST